MRRVYEASQLKPLFQEAKAESVACFGSDEMYLEKLILQPRHIEFQIPLTGLIVGFFGVPGVVAVTLFYLVI